MKVYYPIKSTWEMDYFIELLPPPKFEFVYYNGLPPENVNGCILVVSTVHSFNFNYTKQLKPACLIILSDEEARLYNFTTFDVKIFKNYIHRNETNFIYIPLGYAKGMLGGKPSTEIKIKKIKDREYKYSFIGSMKQNRKEMFEIFPKHFTNGYIKHSHNHWILETQTISPPDMFEIYSNSVFVPTGRGNYSLDCFRIYEAIVSGAIPVVVGSENEIVSVFTLNGKMVPLLYSDTWEHAVEKCKSYTTDELQTIQDQLILWWKWQLDFVKSELNLI